MLNAYDMPVTGDTYMTKILFLSPKNVHSTDGRQKNKLPSGTEQGIYECTECWGTEQKSIGVERKGTFCELVPAD